MIETKGLIVLPEWAELILSGRKTIEVRGTNTKIHGTICIIESGSGYIFGFVDVISIGYLSKQAFEASRQQRLITTDWDALKYKYPHG